jgi:hypothetical protein
VETAYDPAAWHDLYLMAGTVAGGLTGLIFVAVSLQLETVLADRWHRGTAGSSLLALMSVVVISGALLVPDQPRVAVGAEVTILAVASPLYNLVALLHLPSSNRAIAVVKLVVGIIGGLLAVTAGISLLIGAGGGLWLLLPAAAIALTSSVLNAWRLMVDIAEGAGPNRG